MNYIKRIKKKYIPTISSDPYVIVEKQIHPFTRKDFDKDVHKEKFCFCSVYHIRYIMFTEIECTECKIIEYKSTAIPKVELICDSFNAENIYNIKEILMQFPFFLNVEFVFKNELNKIISKLNGRKFASKI